MAKMNSEFLEDKNILSIQVMNNYSNKVKK